MKKHATFAILAGLTMALATGCATETAEEEAQSGEDAFTVRPSRHAIVLAHGFDASPTNIWAFYKVAATLRADGHVVHEGQVSPFKPVPTRAAELARHVDDAIAECRAKQGCDPSKVHIVAHSMGGLDSRYLVSKLGYGDRVASVTTIATPHHGTLVADVGLKLLPGDVNKAVSALATLLGRTFTTRDLAEGSDLAGAFRSISETYTTQTFNREVVDDPRVTYLSYAGVSSVLGIPNAKDSGACDGLFAPKNGRDHMNAALLPAAPIVAHGTELRPNDGLVTVESAKWGKFMGCLPADHLDEVGQPKHDSPNVHGGFDHLDFYRRLASKLDDEVARHDASR
jgi:triacylglycerol lipase